jgi:hypothetical protein
MFSTTDTIDFAENNPDIVARVGWGSSARGAYSLDGALTWAPFTGTPQAGAEAGWIAVAADAATFVWAPNQSPPSYSRNRGASWTRCAGISTSVRVVADRVNANKFYAFDSANGAVYASTDGGATFSSRATGLPTGNNGLRAAPGQEGHLWLAAGNGGLYRSVDSGTQFTRLSSAQSALALGFGRAASGQSYPALYMTGKVESVAGVFRSDTTGASWVRINDDQHQYGWIGRAVTGDPRIFGRVYLGTNGRGVLYADPAP